jgi:hypothetical protein
MTKNFTQFTTKNKQERVKYIETLRVAKGVSCKVYVFPNDTDKDLGIIYIQPGCKTPLQKVLQGKKTIEGYISGKGKLIVKRKDGNTKIIEVNSSM